MQLKVILEKLEHSISILKISSRFSSRSQFFSSHNPSLIVSFHQSERLISQIKSSLHTKHIVTNKPSKNGSKKADQTVQHRTMNLFTATLVTHEKNAKEVEYHSFWHISQIESSHHTKQIVTNNTKQNVTNNP